ncbi:hypothetical protein HK105_202318 [Polyrhizophydium stewartii]|uniref:Mitochondrial ribosomal protein L53 n=1 Tax=Polyrhizophydium stewartii TaxID=2732419 RepID=A0ABR4NEF3_9FUNG
MLKFIERVTVQFAPLSKNGLTFGAAAGAAGAAGDDGGCATVLVVWRFWVCAGARTVVGLLQTDKNIATNPKCVINVEASDKAPAPFVEVIYTDKKTLRLDARVMSSDEMLESISKHSRRLQMDEDIRSSA